MMEQTLFKQLSNRFVTVEPIQLPSHAITTRKVLMLAPTMFFSD